jgi:hypothetical protein
VREGLPADHQHALVAVRDLGHEALRHDRARAHVRDRLENHVAVRVGARTRKIIVPPMPSSFFTMTSPCVSMKDCSSQVARDQGFGSEGGKAQYREFFVPVAQGAWAVHHPRAFGLGALEQERGVVVLLVEGRVLAHEHPVESVRPGFPRRAGFHTMGRRPR